MTTTSAQIPLALRCVLRGSRLIEASAGTGKTFTISALYLRLVLGHGGDAGFGRELLPPDILVVTFTEAATQELRDRIRARLVQAAQAFRDELDELDPILQGLRADYPEADWASCARKLDIAAQWMDQAAVSTIHSWCQRMLREHAFDSGSLFTQTLETDQRELLAEVARDYWRLHCYRLHGRALAWVDEHWQQPDALLARTRVLLDQKLPVSTIELQSLIEESLASAAAELEALKAPWFDWANELEGILEKARDAKAFNGTSLNRKNLANWLDKLREWATDAQAQTLEIGKGFERLTHQGLAEIWKQGSPPEHPALEAIAELKTRLAALASPAQPALRHAAGWMAERFDAEKRRRAQMGFDDMLTRLDDALQGDNGERLSEVIRTQFPVAMIDEFQDTDPLQYRIFDRIYPLEHSPEDTALLLIGDPKQAIYSFRGADIFTYLYARRATQGRHEHLDTNFRSSQPMVAAVNHVFDLAEQRADQQGAFRFGAGAEALLPFQPVAAQGRKERWMLHGQIAPALTAWHLHSDEPLTGEAYRQQMAARCASAMVELLQAGQSGQAGFEHPKDGWQGVRPADMAVLVRTGREAEMIRNALAERGVRSVYLSDKDSVLDSQEAVDVLRWLRACAEPGNDRLLRAALASPTLDQSWATLERLNEDERLWEHRVFQFTEYRRLWQRQGVLPMLHRLLHDFDLPARLLQRAHGQRQLTNLLHLAEMLQRAARELDGEQALVRHLAELIPLAGEGAGEEQILRLESDAELVKVVTIHKSKGLEYPLVFLPFICHSRPLKSGEPARFHDGERRTLVLEPSEAERRLADAERLGEDLRLLYVALTRARHACWLGMADLKSGQSKSSVLHHSAVGHLLAGGQALSASPALAEWLQPWRDVPAEVIAVSPAPEVQEQVYQPLQALPPQILARQPQHASFESWWIASYSALAIGSEELGGLGRGIGNAPDNPAAEKMADDERAARFIPLRAGELPTIHRFPRGPQPGTFLHGLLELAGREGFAVLADRQQCIDWLRPRCIRRGWGVWTECLADWLISLLRQPALLRRVDSTTELCLADLSPGQYQPEMEFMFSARRVDVQQLDHLVCAATLDGQPRPALLRDRLNGLFKGFIDLVFEHQGRYYVVDYKSNWLGASASDYVDEAMQRVILEQRYDLQYVFYVLALHRQLKARLPDYDYETHMGGALYWFVRGVDSPQAGLWHDRPPKRLIEDLDRLFMGQPAVESAL
ncbi:MAG: exodeoxyribonuclease V subunit beta [Gammaproteobacteria bacterium HGW-Gammaproteobacteria-11]|nr:MAG: exodeoxyribonuclease V subunit beta [Gammaproteobacteria bacterium HGW-Gammaproteobacteria-11]